MHALRSTTAHGRRSRRAAWYPGRRSITRYDDESIFAEVQHGDDVGMDEPRGDQRFLLEALPHARQRPRLGPQDLHRHPAFETLVEGVEDAGHAALAQEAVDPVAALRSAAPCASPPGLCTPRSRLP